MQKSIVPAFSIIVPKKKTSSGTLSVGRNYHIMFLLNYENTLLCEDHKEKNNNSTEYVCRVQQIHLVCCGKRKCFRTNYPLSKCTNKLCLVAGEKITVRSQTIKQRPK